jgi:hypothetical protein
MRRRPSTATLSPGLFAWTRPGCQRQVTLNYEARLHVVSVTEGGRTHPAYRYVFVRRPDQPSRSTLRTRYARPMLPTQQTGRPCYCGRFCRPARLWDGCVGVVV